MAALAFEVPSVQQIKFWRWYRDEAGTARRESVAGVCFVGTEFSDFACFLDESKLPTRWIIIHRKSGKSLGESCDFDSIPRYLQALNQLMAWGNVVGLKRKSQLFEMVAGAAKVFGIENL